MNLRDALTCSRIARNIGILCVPIAVAVVGTCYTTAIRDREIRARYVEVAIGVLRANPEKQTAELRPWAIGIIEKFSPVALSPKAKEELEKKPLALEEFARRHNLGAIMVVPGARP